MTPPLEFFTESSFTEPVAPLNHWRKELAKQANALLNAKLGPEVVSFGEQNAWYKDTYAVGFNPTHSARLFNPEPLKKEPCKHEPFEFEVGKKLYGGFPMSPGSFQKFFEGTTRAMTDHCRHCGVKLVAEWKAVE